MAGTVTITHQKIGMPDRPIRKVSFAWTSDAAGVADGVTTDKISGEIVCVTFDPGTPAPTVAYVVTITDEAGIDVLAGQGAVGIALSATVSSAVVPGVPFKDGTTTSVARRAVDDLLTLSVTAGGNAKQGVVNVYVR